MVVDSGLLVIGCGMLGSCMVGGWLLIKGGLIVAGW